MLPLLGALVGAGGSIAAGLIGANASDEAAEQNWKINLLNYYQRERERQDRIREATINRRDQKLGFNDADGGSTKFIEGVGWVTKRGEQQDKIAKAQQREQLNVLNLDMPMRRRGMERNEKRSRSEDLLAQALMRDFQDVRKTDDRTLADLLFDSATRNLDEQFNNQTEVALRQGMRMGASNIDKILKGINDSRAKATSDASMDAKLKARGLGEAEFAQKRGSLGQLYNMFASRAQALPDVSYRPQDVDGSMNNFMSQGSKQLLDANNGVTSAAGQKGGTMDYIQPNYGWANAVGSGASALGSALRFAGTQGFDGDVNGRLRRGE